MPVYVCVFLRQTSTTVVSGWGTWKCVVGRLFNAIISISLSAATTVEMQSYSGIVKNGNEGKQCFFWWAMFFDVSDFGKYYVLMKERISYTSFIKLRGTPNMQE